MRDKKNYQKTLNRVQNAKHSLFSINITLIIVLIMYTMITGPKENIFHLIIALMLIVTVFLHSYFTAKSEEIKHILSKERYLEKEHKNV